jgi:aryl-alcohol dehydrogenase-like predicted oxidoreductase
MPLNHYVTLGRSGLRVSPMCLGAMTFGEEWGYGSNPEDSGRIMDRYIDLGGNFIDTANMYTEGHSEAIIGEHLGHDAARRGRLVIATKFCGNLHHGDPNGGGASRKSIIAACEQSLRRLRTDYIDLYWMHWRDSFTPIDETMDALDDLVRAGKVRYVGFSDTSAWRCAQAQTTAHFRGWAPLVALQIPYSLLERTVEGELMPMAQELGLGVTPWSPLAAGALSGKYTRDKRTAESPGRSTSLSGYLNERAFGIIDVVCSIAKALETTPSRVALAWLLSRPGVTSPIIGVRKIEQLLENVAALNLKLSADEIDRLNAVSTPLLNFPAGVIGGFAPGAYGGLTINECTIPIGFRTIKAGAHVW